MNRSISVLVLASFLWLFGSWAALLHSSVQASPTVRIQEPATKTATSLLLDQYPDAYAAYSLRKLRSEYSGPAIRVRRGSDGAEQDFGFSGNGKLNVAAIESWLSGANGYVKTWYSQAQGEPDLTQTDTARQPRIAEEGTAFTDSDGRVAIKFDRTRNTFLALEGDLSKKVQIHESLVYAVGESGVTNEEGAKPGIISLSPPGSYGHNTLTLRGRHYGGGQKWRSPIFEGTNYVEDPGQPAFWAANQDGAKHVVYSNNSPITSKEIIESQTLWGLTLGVRSKGTNKGYDGYLSEVAILPGRSKEEGVQGIYDLVNEAWALGPKNYSPGALMPQKYEWQVTLYNWLETINVEEVTLPDKTIEWSGTLSDTEKMADLYLQLQSASSSRVT